MRDSQLQEETVRYMQQLLGTGGDSERNPATMRDSERLPATPWDWVNSERQLVTMGDSESTAATPWH